MTSMATNKSEMTREVEKGKDTIRLADSSKCKVYVCFEGLLGTHLKLEVREKIWKGEYSEICMLLLLEKFKPDGIKLEESKKRGRREATDPSYFL